MTYKVIARKWRPQQFDDEVGQQTIARTLQNAIQLGRIAHAYLFTGTRGVGKTSTARILAKALNCTSGPTPRPCDTCLACTEIMQGNATDVLEIDAASNRGIGEIRELRENVQYAPSRDRHKIFIIDEVHMLTTEAFNALLKTLEEPPPHVIFILATTELYKIPQTIVSRCQQFDFRIISFEEIFQRLKKILTAESIQISDQSLRAVVKASGGSMRDAESALQKIISLGGEQISDEDVSALLGVVQQEYLNRMMQAILAPDYQAVVDIIQQLFERGHDLQNFLRAFIEFVRHVTVCKIAQAEYHLSLLPAEDLAYIRTIAGQLQVEELIRYYDLLLKSDNELRWPPFGQFHVEMTFLKLASLPHLVSLEEIIAAISDRSGAAPGLVRPPSRPALAAPPAAPAHSPAPAAPAAAQATARGDAERWKLFVEAISRQLVPLRPLLDRIEARLTGHRLEIRTASNSIFEKQFSSPATQEQLKGLYRELFAAPLEIAVIGRDLPVEKPRETDEQKAREEQKKIEADFLEDPVARTLIDRVTGKWVFKKQF